MSETTRESFIRILCILSPCNITEKELEVLLWRFVNNLPYRKIAKLLESDGCKPTDMTVKRNMDIALKQIRRDLSKEAL